VTTVPTPELPPELAAELSVREIAGAEYVTALSGGGYFPTMLKLLDGSLGAVVRGGAPHVGLLSRLDWIRSWDGGRSWNFESTIVPATLQWDNRGSSAGQMPDGTLVVGYWENFNYHGYRFDYWANDPTKAYYIYSVDGGLTWSRKQRLDARPACTGAVLFGRIITLSDGVSLMPAYGGAKGLKGCRSILLRSRNRGRNWGEPSVIADGYNEVSLCLLKDGTLLAAMRDDASSHGATWVARSADAGQTWSAPVQVTKLRQHPADILQLASGNVLLTYGNRIGDLAVGAVLSRDGGATWDIDRRVILARGSMTLRGKNGCDTGYPSTVQLDDGAIVTLYDRLGHTGLAPEELERCRQYERDTFGPNPPASPEMRRFEQAVAVRYREEQL